MKGKKRHFYGSTLSHQFYGKVYSEEEIYNMNIDKLSDEIEYIYKYGKNYDNIKDLQFVCKLYLKYLKSFDIDITSLESELIDIISQSDPLLLKEFFYKLYHKIYQKIRLKNLISKNSQKIITPRTKLRDVDIFDENNILERGEEYRKKKPSKSTKRKPKKVVKKCKCK
jgi:hypothetical protein